MTLSAATAAGKLHVTLFTRDLRTIHAEHAIYINQTTAFSSSVASEDPHTSKKMQDDFI
jgi:hypothetical protein